MPVYPADSNDTLVYNGVDLYIPKDCSCTVFDDSRVFLFGEFYLNGQPILTGASPPSGVEVQVGPAQPTDGGIKLWFDTSTGYGELKVLQAGSWFPVEDPADAVAANEVSIGVGQPVASNYELWVNTNTVPETLNAKVGGTWKNLTVDEVSIGGTEPTDPNIELWVDTATSAPPVSQSYINPGNAIGVVAIGSFVSASTLISANSTVNIMNPLSFTSIVGRKYKIKMFLRITHLDSFTGNPLFHISYNFAGSGVPGANTFSPVGNSYTNLYIESMFDGTGVTSNYTCTGASSDTYAARLWTDIGSYVHIEDIGPNSSPALPVPTPDPPWTPVSAFQNNWSPFGGSNAIPAYRKIGDIVSLRGAVKSSTQITVNTTSVIFTLPVGFRPPSNMNIFSTQSADDTWGIAGSLSIVTNGNVAVPKSNQGPTRPDIFTSWDTSFSVTP